MQLTDLIITSRVYLDRFDNRHYPSDFKDFEGQLLAFFDASEISDLTSAASILIDELEQRRASLPRRDQREALRRDRMVLALYLSPAAVQLGGSAAAFSTELNICWNARYPKSSYHLGTYESIMEGFELTVLGLPLRRR